MFKWQKDEIRTIINFQKPIECISWAPLNGGIKNQITTVINRTLDQWVEIEDIERFLINDLKKLRIKPSSTIIMLTLVKQRFMQLQTSLCPEIGLQIWVFCTAGIGNALAPGDLAEFTETKTELSLSYLTGTINLIVVINKSITLPAKIELISSIIAPAKGAAMIDLGIYSRISNNLSLGTGTDCITLCTPEIDNYPFKFAGLHTKLGQIVGMAVKKATTNAINARNC